MARPSIRDIASACGVSPSTVSRALNHSGPVSAQLASRIESSAQRLGYRPSSTARSLRTRRTLTIGVVTPDISDRFFATMVRAIEDGASARGYAVHILSSDHDLEKERLCLHAISDRQVDGAIVTVSDRDESDLSPLLNENVPVVLVHGHLTGSNLDYVSIDNAGGVASAVRMLVERGRKRIALVATSFNISSANDRIDAFLEATRNAGLPTDEELLIRVPSNEAGGIEAGNRLVAMRDPADAVIVSNNQMFPGLLSVIRERKVRVPEDLAIIAFDDNIWMRLLDPAITVVGRPSYEMGKAAAETLFARILGQRDAAAREVLLPTELIVRGSC